MITLDDVLTKLQLTTSGTAAVDVSVQFVDETHEGTRSVAASQETAITTATTTDVLAVPATSNRRIVQQVVVSNKGGVANTVTLLKDVNGTDYRIGGAVALAAGEWLVVAGTGEFQVFEADGTLKVAGGAAGGGDALTTDPLSQFAATTSAQLAGVISDETGSGALVFATSPTLVTPALGTPASGVATNLTGTAAGLTAGNVTTNANLTGPITSTGNATAVAAQTGTGSTFVMQATPTLTTPILGTPTSGTLTNCTGLPITTGLTGGNWKVVYTNGAATPVELALGSVGQMLRSAGAAAAPTFANAWTLILKTADENRASNTTLTDDSALVVTLAASTKYLIRCKVFTTIANATMDYKFATAYSGTVTGNVYTTWRAMAGGVATGTGAEFQGIASGQIASQALTASTSGIGHIYIEQSIETTNTGTWSFQWAQNTSDAGNATVGRGSYIEYMVIP